jgi:heme-degrading monooxygenase HmoA
MPSSAYYAVIFTSTRKATPKNSPQAKAYAEMAAEMDHLVAQQPGYLGVESVSNMPLDDGQGVKTITVSYWKDQQSISDWKRKAEHLVAQRMGRKDWYKSYTTRVCLVEREYSFEARDDSPYVWS